MPAFDLAVNLADPDAFAQGFPHDVVPPAAARGAGVLAPAGARARGSGLLRRLEIRGRAARRPDPADLLVRAGDHARREQGGFRGRAIEHAADGSAPPCALPQARERRLHAASDQRPRAHDPHPGERDPRRGLGQAHDRLRDRRRRRAAAARDRALPRRAERGTRPPSSRRATGCSASRTTSTARPKRTAGTRPSSSP